jgi:PleD family two-component response regulator
MRQSLPAAVLSDEARQITYNKAQECEKNVQEESMAKPKILVVDDKASIRSLVMSYLRPEEYEVYVLTRLRRESDAYVILLTARSEETDKIVGL